MPDFLNPRNTFEDAIRRLEGIAIGEGQNSKVIEIKKEVPLEKIMALLEVLRTHAVAFSVYDSLYPSPSDPGAYLDYSQEKNETEDAWSMTLGNHGWTGGIYTIDEKNIALQLWNLVRKGQMDCIGIEKVKIFSHYDKQNLDHNRNQNALIYGIHSNISEVDADYLIFGRFSSDTYNPYNIYKLTADQLLVDKSETWHVQRHDPQGYIFEGEALSNDQFEAAHQLLKEIPLQLLTNKWKGFYTTGNKNEDKLIAAFKNTDFHKTVTIDSYEIETEKLPLEVKDFRQKIENLIRKLDA